MALITWKEIYSVNIAKIDNEHKGLINLINELHAAILAGKGKEVMSDVLGNLVQYTVNHFATEENYFDEYNYPESEKHKKQHRDLTEQVGALQKKFEMGEKVLTIDVMNFLRDWLHDHIVGTDKLYGPYLNSKGIQ